MSERNKKIVFTIFFVIFSVGMGYGLYWLFFKGKPTLTSLIQPEPITGQLPQAGTGAPQTYVTPTIPGALPSSQLLVSPSLTPETTTPSEPVKTQLLRDGLTQAVSPTPDRDGARFYNPEDGRFYKVTEDGTISLLGSKQFFNIDTVNWGNREDQVILEFPDGSNIYYDFEAKQQVTLPKHWENFDFSNDDHQVAAKSMGVDIDNRWLLLSKPDGSEARAIAPLGNNAKRVHVGWDPNGDIAAYSLTGEPRPDNEQEILFVGKNQENFRSLIAPGQGFLPNWSPTGKNLLFSVWNISTQNKPTLWLTDGRASNMGENRRSLNLNTWADKCAWASDTELFCAVPRTMPDLAGMNRAANTTLSDDIYHVDLNSGSSEKINTSDLTYAINQPVLNRDKSKLIFTDAATGRLYSYDLK